MSLVRKALAYSFASQYILILLQLATSIVVARLLLPEEVGVYSIAALAVALTQVLSDFGSTQYLIVERELTQDKIRAAFTVSLAVGLGLAVASLAISTPLGDFYQSDGVTEVMQLLALNFALLPFGTVPAAILRREMNFAPNAIAAVSAGLIQTTTIITLALNGFSYMSMAWGGIAGTVTSMLIINIFRPKGLPWLPGLKNVRTVLAFGMNVSTADIFRQIGASAPELIVGKSLGLHAAGLLSRTNGVLAMFTSMVVKAIGPIVVPYYAKINKEAESIRHPYLNIVACITGLAWPFFGVLVFLSPYLVPFLFGENWNRIIPLVQMLSIGSIFYYLTSTVENLLTAMGHVRLALRITATMSIIRITILGIAALYSLEHVAVAAMSLSLIRIAVTYKSIRIYTGTNLQDHIDVAKQSALIALPPSLTAAISCLLLDEMLGLTTSIVFIVGGAAAFAAFLIALKMSNHPIRSEIEKMVAQIVRRKHDSRGPEN